MIEGAALDTAAFRTAWALWEQHRRERKPKLTPTARKLAIKKLLAIGPQRAVAAIEHSIANGWQGIFEANGNGGGGRPGRLPAQSGEYADIGEEVRV